MRQVTICLAVALLGVIGASFLWGLTPVFTVVTALGELGIVAAIYLEIESTRLDGFFEHIFKREHWDARREIYEAYCSLPEPTSQKFCDLLRMPHNPLRNVCDEQMRLLQMIGGQLPWWPPFRKRVLNWFPHAIIFMWVILGAYVQERRKSTGWSLWANDVENLARAAAQHILKIVDGGIVLVDPDQQRANDYAIPRERLEKIAKGSPAI